MSIPKLSYLKITLSIHYNFHLMLNTRFFTGYLCQSRLSFPQTISFLLLLFISWFPQIAQSQTYILNEDFSSAAGTTPPVDWMNTTITGQTTDKWRFDNPGNRTISY